MSYEAFNINEKAKSKGKRVYDYDFVFWVLICFSAGSADLNLADAAFSVTLARFLTLLLHLMMLGWLTRELPSNLLPVGPCRSST